MFHLSLERTSSKSSTVFSTGSVPVLLQKKSLAKGNRFQAFCEMSFSFFRHWLHMNECSLPGFVEDLHFLWTHKPHLSQEISLFLTDLEQTKHGHFTGPGCRFISPDNSERYLKYQRRFENFNLDSAYSEHCS